MEIYIEIPFELKPDMLMQQVHIRTNSEDADEFHLLIELARQVGKPKAMYTEAYVVLTGKDSVALNGILLTSHLLRDNLANVERVFPYVATCGHEIDQVNLPNDHILGQFWWDAIKQSLLTSALEYLHMQIEGQNLLTKTSSMNPGSGDMEVWPIQQQRNLFALLGDVRSHIGVELTDSYLMIPNKTVSGILFPTEKDFRTCQVCHRQNCPSRSAPFDQTLWASLQRKEQ